LKISAKLKQTAGYFYAFVILGAVISALGPTIDGLASNLGRTATALSFLFSFRAAGYLTGSLGGGYLYEKVRGNRALGFVLLFLSATLLLTPYLQTTIPLIIALILTGISCGATDVGSNTLLAYTHKKQVGPYINAMYSAQKELSDRRSSEKKGVDCLAEEYLAGNKDDSCVG